MISKKRICRIVISNKNLQKILDFFVEFVNLYVSIVIRNACHRHDLFKERMNAAIGLKNSLFNPFLSK